MVKRVFFSLSFVFYSIAALAGTDHQHAEREPVRKYASNAGFVAVSITNFSFSPQNISISVGTTVTWTNNDAAPHTATANGGAFNSGTLTQGQSFQFTFNSTGNFPYACLFHGGMTGSVEVTQSSPAITSIEPPNGSTGGGTTVTIAGSDFNPDLSLTFGGLAATVLEVTTTQIVATTPAHAAGAVDVVVTNTDGGTVTQTDGFTYVVPVIANPTAVAPTSGPASGGTPITVTGSDFQGGATIALGGMDLQTTYVSPSTLTATTPPLAAATLHDVLVTNPGVASGSLVGGFFADFADVAQSHPFHDWIETIVRHQITAGCGGANYCPGGSITRAQMAVFLLRAKHGPAYVPPPATGTVFSDVPQNAFAAAWIEQLAAEGITAGCGGDLFCPGSTVNREQMAVFLLVAYEIPGYSPIPAIGMFDDVPTSSPFAKWIEELARRGITAGCGNNNYCPSSPVTRGQMGVFLVETWGFQ